MARSRKRATKRKIAKKPRKKVRKLKPRAKKSSHGKKAARGIFGGIAAPEPLEAFEGERPTTKRPPVGGRG